MFLFFRSVSFFVFVFVMIVFVMIVIVMIVIVMIVAGVATMIRRLQVGQVIELFGGHQPRMRISDSSQVFSACLEVQLPEHAVAANVGVLF